MKKETVKMLFVLAIALANLVLVFTMISSDTLLEQKRDFDGLVAGDSINIIKDIKDKVGSYKIVSTDRVIVKEQASPTKKIVTSELSKDKTIIKKEKKIMREDKVGLGNDRGKVVAGDKNGNEVGAKNE